MYGRAVVGQGRDLGAGGSRCRRACGRIGNQHALPCLGCCNALHGSTNVRYCNAAMRPAEALRQYALPCLGWSTPRHTCTRHVSKVLEQDQLCKKWLYTYTRAPHRLEDLLARVELLVGCAALAVPSPRDALAHGGALGGLQQLQLEGEGACVLGGVCGLGACVW